MQIKNKILEKDAKELVYILIVLIPMFTLINKYPYLSIFSFILLFLAGFVFFLKNRTISQQHLRIDILLLLICFYLIFSYIISKQPITNIFTYGFLRNDGNFFFSYSPFFVFAIPFLDYKKALRIYFWFLFSVFVFFAVIGLFEYLNGHHFLTIRIDDIYVGPMLIALNNSHNATGSVLAVVSIFAAAFFFKSNSKEKIAYGLIAVLCFGALVITKSRGSLIAFVIGVLYILLIGSGSFLKFLRNILILAVVSAPLVFITGTFGRIMQIFKIYDQSALTRLSLWDRAIYLFRQSPIIGIGFGRYNDVAWNFDRVQLSGSPGIIGIYTSSNYVFNDTNAHSSYFHFLAETGVIGLLFIVAFWLLCFTIIYKAYKRTRDAFSKKVYLAVTGGIITLFVLALTENYMTAPTVMLCLSFATSLAIGLSGKERSEVLKR